MHCVVSILVLPGIVQGGWSLARCSFWNQLKQGELFKRWIKCQDFVPGVVGCTRREHLLQHSWLQMTTPKYGKIQTHDTVTSDINLESFGSELSAWCGRMSHMVDKRWSCYSRFVSLALYMLNRAAVVLSSARQLPKLQSQYFNQLKTGLRHREANSFFFRQQSSKNGRHRK